MGEHRPLGHTGSASGVLQHGDVFLTDLDRLQCMALALLEGILEGHRLRQVVVRHHLLDLLDHGVDQPALEAWQQVAHLGFDQVIDLGIRQHVLDQLAEHIQVHQRTYAGILELVAHLAGGVQRVGVDHNQPGAHGTEHGDWVLQHVGHLHSDAVTRLQVGILLQVGGKGRRQPIQLGIGQGHAQVAEGGPVGELLARTLEHLDHRFISPQIDVIRYAGRAFVAPEIRLHYFYPLALRWSDPRCGVGWNLTVNAKQANSRAASLTH